MRRTILTLLAIAAMFFAAGPASAAVAATDTGDGWQPVHYEPWHLPAGARCDFAMSSEYPVNEVKMRTVSRYPDGSTHREQYTGALIIRITNTETGAVTDADASGDAMVEYHKDGSMVWYVNGPVLVGFAEHGGNMPKGLYIIDGVYTIHFSPDGYKTVKMAEGEVHDICAELS